MDNEEEFTFYTFNDLEKSGLLWLINRCVFHPRGFVFGLIPDENGNIAGWTVVGDGKKPLQFDFDMDEIGFLTVETFFAKMRGWHI